MGSCVLTVHGNWPLLYQTMGKWEVLRSHIQRLNTHTMSECEIGLDLCHDVFLWAVCPDFLSPSGGRHYASDIVFQLIQMKHFPLLLGQNTKKIFFILYRLSTCFSELVFRSFINALIIYFSSLFKSTECSLYTLYYEGLLTILF